MNGRDAPLNRYHFILFETKIKKKILYQTYFDSKLALGY